MDMVVDMIELLRWEEGLSPLQDLMVDAYL